MPPLPPATLAQLRARVEAEMQTPVTLVTKTGTRTSGGVTETPVDGLTVYGRLYRRTILQQLGESTGGGVSALGEVTALFVQVPAANTLKVKDMVKIAGVYYEVADDATAVDDHTLLANAYRVRRLDVGVR